MRDWYFFAFCSFAAWGLWAFFSKVSTTFVSPASTMVYETIGVFAVGFITFAVIGFRPDAQPQGVLFGLASGVTLALGHLFFVYALNHGKVSVVTVLTALYPIITILLAVVFLKEGIRPRQALGMAFALVSILLFLP